MNPNLQRFAQFWREQGDAPTKQLCDDLAKRAGPAYAQLPRDTLFASVHQGVLIWQNLLETGDPEPMLRRAQGIGTQRTTTQVDIDQVMRRTARRPLPSQAVRPRSALLLGLALAALATLLMAAFTNWLATALNCAGLTAATLRGEALLDGRLDGAVVLLGSIGFLWPICVAMSRLCPHSSTAAANSSWTSRTVARDASD